MQVLPLAFTSKPSLDGRQTSPAWMAELLFLPPMSAKLGNSSSLNGRMSIFKRVWSCMSTWANCPSLSPNSWTADQDLQGWFTQLTVHSNQHMKGLQTLVLLVVWSLWKERSKRIFQQEELTTTNFISLLRDSVRTWIFAGVKHLDSFGHIFQE